jgi:hypothetical protein
MSKHGEDVFNYGDDNKVAFPIPNTAITTSVINTALPPCTSLHDMLSNHGFEIHKSDDTLFIAKAHVYTRDSTGTVVKVTSSDNIPLNELVLVVTQHASTGAVLYRELRFKIDVINFFTGTSDPHLDFSSAHYDEDENTTTHYTCL